MDPTAYGTVIILSPVAEDSQKVGGAVHDCGHPSGKKMTPCQADCTLDSPVFLFTKLLVHGNGFCASTV